MRRPYPEPDPSFKSPSPPYYGYTDIDDGDNRIMNEEELAAYYREVDESEGFDVQTIPCSLLCGAIRPIDDIKTFHTEKIQHGAEEAIKDYNQKNQTNFEVVEIEKSTLGGSYGFEFYITFKAKPSDMPSDSPTTTFQAKVVYWRQFDVKQFGVKLCKIKSSN